MCKSGRVFAGMLHTGNFNDILFSNTFANSLLQESKAIYAATPFDPKNRLIVTAADVSSKYTRRTALEYTRIGQYIKAITISRRGNYLGFIPSYTFRDEVEAYMEKEENVRYIRQESSITETQREEFIDAFREQQTPTHAYSDNDKNYTK